MDYELSITWRWTRCSTATGLRIRWVTECSLIPQVLISTSSYFNMLEFVLLELVFHLLLWLPFCRYYILLLFYSLLELCLDFSLPALVSYHFCICLLVFAALSSVRREAKDVKLNREFKDCGICFTTDLNKSSYFNLEPHPKWNCYRDTSLSQAV